MERTKKAAAMPATAAQCFGSTETLQAYLHPPVREFSSNKPDDFPWRAQRERCFNVLVGSLRPACAGEGGQLSAAAAVTGYSGLSLNDGSPPQC